MQLLFALIDQTLFGKQPLPAKDTTAVVADLKHRHTSFKHVEGTHWQTRFCHLISYGAGAYPVPFICSFCYSVIN
jgi:intermediate peptidase